MKKSLLITLISAMTLVMAPSAAAFSDVRSDSFYKTSIDWMADQGVIEGYTDGTFRPDGCVNRVEFLKMLYLTLGVESWGYTVNHFSDTFADQWYSDFVTAARARRSINGYPTGDFRPAQCVNNVEAVKVAMIEFGFMKEDASTGGEWYEAYVDDATDRKVLPLFGDFDPGADMTRAQVAELLYRLKTLRDHNFVVWGGGAEPIAAGYVPGEMIDVEVEELGVGFSYPAEWGELIIKENDTVSSGVAVRGREGDMDYYFMQTSLPSPYDRGGFWLDRVDGIEYVDEDRYCDDFDQCEDFNSELGLSGFATRGVQKNDLEGWGGITNVVDAIHVFDHPWDWYGVAAVTDHSLVEANLGPNMRQQVKDVVDSLYFLEQPEFMKGSEVMEAESFEFMPENVHLRFGGAYDSSCEAPIGFDAEFIDNELIVTSSNRRIAENCTGDISIYELAFPIEHLIDTPGTYRAVFNGLLETDVTIP